MSIDNFSYKLYALTHLQRKFSNVFAEWVTSLGQHHLVSSG